LCRPFRTNSKRLCQVSIRQIRISFNLSNVKTPRWTNCASTLVDCCCDYCQSIIIYIRHLCEISYVDRRSIRQLSNYYRRHLHHHHHIEAPDQGSLGYTVIKCWTNCIQIIITLLQSHQNRDVLIQIDVWITSLFDGIKGPIDDVCHMGYKCVINY
jgi:hypothetical protein